MCDLLEMNVVDGDNDKNTVGTDLFTCRLCPTNWMCSRIIETPGGLKS